MLRPVDSCAPACFQTGSVRPKPDTSQPEPNQIRTGFAQNDLGRLWKNATKSESGKPVVCRLHSARIRPDDSCTPACFRTRCFGQNRTRPSRSNQGRFCTIIRPESKWNQTRCGKSDWVYAIQPDSGCMLAIMTITGHKQNASGFDPARLQG